MSGLERIIAAVPMTEKPETDHKKNAANEETYGENQLSPEEFQKSRGENQKPEAGEVNVRKIADQKALEEAYLSMAEIYTSLEQLMQTRKSQAILLPDEEQRVEELVKRYISINVLVNADNVNHQQIAGQFRRLVEGGDIKKVQAHAERYAEYAIDSTLNVERERQQRERFHREVQAIVNEYHTPEEGDETIVRSPKI